ncbi:MAG: putative arabinosidase [Chthonomonadaceae bacterium]|nr:putative arabinosidase [Chthonomonadaceae bacterium]
MSETPQSKPTRAFVVDTTLSPEAIWKPVAIDDVRLTDAFWEPRIRRNREWTIPSQLKQCEETGRIDNFRRASGKKDMPFQGIFFNDSDVYKWAEAAANSLAAYPDPELDAQLDAVIQEIADAQQPGGYLNTYFMFERENERFTNLKDMHEIYCAGHLFQAAVAHYRATGKTSLLDVAKRLADCLDNTFGPGKRSGACGHEEAEMGLVELYRATGERRYLELADFMVQQRGQKPGLFGNSQYHQDHLPFAEQTEFVGHAVRHLYLACGATDIATEKSDSPYFDALHALWDNLTQRRMYVTGGAGSRWEGEAFGGDYELPNDRAYTETCAAIGSVMWNWRMLLLTGEAKYADLMETTLYNAVLPGLSQDGMHYFYQNPLADRGKHRRQAWFGCACCPPNVARLLAALSGYFYTVDYDRVGVHLYADSSADLTLPGGDAFAFDAETAFPWDGNMTFTVRRAPARPVSLHLRTPWWAESALFAVNGQSEGEWDVDGDYIIIEREWKPGDVVTLELEMTIQRVESHPHVLANRGRVAIQRGPLIYCVEQADHPTADVWDIALPDDAEISAEFLPDLLDGVTVLRTQGVATDPSEWDGALYAPYLRHSDMETHLVDIVAVPYFAWANREAGPMQVWIPTASSAS